MNPDEPVPPPGHLETVILREPWEVESRLHEMGLDRPTLLRVAAQARAEGANATPFHCSNASGTFSYQYGTFFLRRDFVGKIWRIDRAEGVEGIWNDGALIRVVFSNVDICCNDEHPPKPRSKKGSGAERVCQTGLFDGLPQYAPRPTGRHATYYLMVAEDGAVELSRPVIANETFAAYIERLYLSFGGDDGETVTLPLDEDDAVADFDPQVARK
jgi:hypothetical protein